MYKEVIESQYRYNNAPFYLYDEKEILKNIEKFKAVPYNNYSIHFASMANDNPRLLSILKDNGIGLFVNSLKHLRLGLDVGFSSDKIIFASTGINEHVMRTLVDNKIQCNIDSVSQLEMYGSLNPNSKVGIRLNVEEKSKNNIFNGTESRIGVLESELPSIFDIAKKYNLKLNGVHVYLGTDIVSIHDILTGIDKTISLSNYFDDLEFIDFGGGFPLRVDQFDFDVYRTEIVNRMNLLSEKKGRDIKLIIEPGRAMFGNAGKFYAQVTDIKERPDRYLVCVNASASLIPRAMFYEDYNPVNALVERELFPKPVDVTGNTTYSRDFISKNIQLPKVNIGDWIELEEAGSYCYSMITRFLGQDTPIEYLITIDDTLEIIREIA